MARISGARMKSVMLRAAASTLALAALAPSAHAARFIATFNVPLNAATPISFNYMGGTFNFFSSGDFFSPLAVSTAGNAAFRTVFGGPSPDFTDRGYVSYDAMTLGGFGAVPGKTTVNYSNGDNFIGLRVGSGSNFYYGFAYTTNAQLNSIGFETNPNTAIHAVAGVPEPLTWTMLIVGFGGIGAALRRRRPFAQAALSA